MSTPADGAGIDSIVLEEEIDPNYVPSEAEVIEYAKWLGMELDSDQDLFWVAREGLMAPLPKNWKPCKTKDTEDIYYFNFATGDSTWDHPCDGYYKRLYEEEKKKKETNAKESGDQNRTKAKADVEQLLGTKEKKKKMKKVSGLTDLAPPGPGGKAGPGGIAVLGSLERKPLPGISSLTKPAFGQPLTLDKPNSSSLSNNNSHDNQSSIQPLKTSKGLRSSLEETDDSDDHVDVRASNNSAMSKNSATSSTSSKFRNKMGLNSNDSDSGLDNAVSEFKPLDDDEDDEPIVKKTSTERKSLLSSTATNKKRDNSIERSAENTRTNVEREEMIDDHERDMKRLTRKHDNEIADMIDEHEQKMTTKRKEFSADLNRLQDTIADEKAALRKERANLDDEYENMRKSHQDRMLNSKDKDENESKTDSDSRISALLSAAEQNMSDLRNKLRQADVDLDLANRRCDRMEEQHGENERKLVKEKEEAISELNRQLKELRAKISDKDVEHLQLEKEIRQLKINSSSNQVQKKDDDWDNDELVKKAELIADLEKTTKILRSNVDDLTTRNKDLEKSSKECSEALLLLQKENRNINSDDKYRKALDDLKSKEFDLETITRERDRIKEELGSLRDRSKKRTEEQQIELDTCYKNIRILRDDIDDKDRLYEKSKRELKLIESELDKQKSICNHLDSTITDLEIKKLEDEMNVLLTKSSIQEESIQLYENKLKEKENLYKQLEVSNSELKDKISSMEVSLFTLQSSNNTTTQNKDEMSNKITNLLKEKELEGISLKNDKFKLIAEKKGLEEELEIEKNSNSMKIRGFQTEIINLQRKLSSSVNDLTELSNESPSKSSRLIENELELKIQEKDNKILTITKTIDDKDCEILKLSKELNELNQINELKLIEITTLSKSLEDLKKSCDEYEIIKSNQIQLEDKYNKLFQDNLNISNENKTLLQNNIKLNDNNSKLDKQIEEIVFELSIEKEKKIDQKNTNTSITPVNNDIIKNLEQKISTSNSEVISLRNNHDKLIIQCNEIQVKLNNSIKDCETINTSNNFLNTEITRLQEERSKIDTKYREKELEFIKLNREMTINRANVDSLISELDHIKILLKNESTEVNNLTTELTITKTNFTKLQYEYDVLKNELMLKSQQNSTLLPPTPPVIVRAAKPDLSVNIPSIIDNSSTFPNSTINSNGSNTNQFSVAGLVELSIIVGQQQSTVQRLEEKLKEAEGVIFNMNNKGLSPRNNNSSSGNNFNQQENISPNMQLNQANIDEKSLKSKAIDTNNKSSKNNAKSNQFDNEDDDRENLGEYSIMLRDIWTEFSKRRLPFSESMTSPNSPKTDTQQSKIFWTTKVAKERNFIEEAKKLLKEQKKSIRSEQERLNKKREIWRTQKRNIRSDDINGRLTLKSSTKLLNDQTERLNSSIEQTRRTNDWLTERVRKLDSMDRYITKLQSSSEQGNIDENSTALAQLGKDLDNNMSQFGEISLLVTTESEDDIYLQQPLVESRQYSSHSRGIPLGNHYINHNHGHYDPYHNQARDYYQPHSNVQHQFQHQQLYVPPFQQLHNVQESNNYLDQHHQQQQANKRWENRDNGRSNIQQPPVTIIDVQKQQKNIQQLSDERLQSKEACEKHASWLDNLRQEISRFSHSNIGIANGIKKNDTILNSGGNSSNIVFQI